MKGILGVTFYLFPYATNINIHRARGHVSPITPDGIQQLIPSKDATYASAITQNRPLIIT